ncbi:hypothetical protein NXZ75_21925 [Lysinibacillus sphaericus]|uniref:hypothetical protein n=1 Tax=Lysinibacillus sphaericus TaxID=1421 RepID=UPI0021619508|nr:hypothetical protein [Lysinibacillus sphaericus]MCS1384817.1 hypothetical protein [Lysinibacillus sphaericus]
MTKTNYEKLVEINEKAYEIRAKFPTELATEANALHKEQFSKIQNDEELSPLGKRKQVHGLKLDIAYEVLKHTSDAKNEYIKLAAQAIDLAKAIKTEGIKAPPEVDQKLFAQAFDKLKLDASLSITAEKSIEKIEAFIRQYGDPYFATKILEDIGGIVSNVLAINNSPHIRLQLSKLKEEIEGIAISPEIEAANNALIQFSNAEKVKLFRSESIQYKALKQVLDGRLAGMLLADDLEAELLALDAVIGEFVAFKGGDTI